MKIGPIERGIPVKLHHPRSGLTKAIQEMEVGDSRMIDCPNRNKLYTTADRIGYRVQTARQEDGGFRVWRVE